MLEKLVLASHNRDKLREMSELLAPFGVEVVSAADLGLDEPEETETTFAGNARIKAHAAAKATGLPALSDDSGMAADGLDGQPGVYTADWAETPNGRDFPMAMEKTWTRLEERNAPTPRTAQFMCTLCLAYPDGTDRIFEGSVPGQLVWPPRGSVGWGYDPMFLPDGEAQTFGEMDPVRKKSMSHRARALKAFIEAMFG